MKLTDPFDTIININENHINDEVPEYTAKDLQHDPEMLIHGYGVVRLSFAKERVNQYISDFQTLASEESWGNLEALLNNGVFQAFVKALANHI